MPYFTYFPNIEYDIGNTGTTVSLANILRGADVLRELKDNVTFYIRYDYTDTDRPEFISNRLYDTPDLHWVVMKMNDVVDPYYDLPISEYSLRKYVDVKYPGQSFFMNRLENTSSSSSGAAGYTTIDGAYALNEYVYASNNVEYSGTVAGGTLTSMKLPTGAAIVDDFYKNARVSFIGGTGSGQSAIISGYNATTRQATFVNPLTTQLGCDTTFEMYPTGQVHRWDATFSRIEVDSIFGTFDLYDTVVGDTSGTESFLQRKVNTSRDAVHHFGDAETGVWYNPRGDVNYIGGYIMNTGNSTISSAVITNHVYERQQNDNKRFVSLMDPDVIPIAVGNFKNEIRT